MMAELHDYVVYSDGFGIGDKDVSVIAVVPTGDICNGGAYGGMEAAEV